MFRLGKPCELEKLPSILLPNESLDAEISYVKAASDFSYGILVLTNQRIVYFSDGLFQRILISFPLQDIVSINATPLPFGMGYKKITILTHNESVRYKNVPKQSGESFVHRAQQIIRQLPINSL